MKREPKYDAKVDTTQDGHHGLDLGKNQRKHIESVRMGSGVIKSDSRENVGIESRLTGVKGDWSNTSDCQR